MNNTHEIPQPRRAEPADAVLAQVPSNPTSKEYADFRDRAAYVYITGSFPTHIRTHFTSLLRMVTRYSREPVAFDKVAGHMEVLKEYVNQLRLDDHPMVRKTRSLIDTGYRIRSHSVGERRRYGKVRLVKAGAPAITVQVDGSIIEE